MSILQRHDAVLYGGNDVDIVLRPLGDEHLPLLRAWHMGPEEMDTAYGDLSRHAHCFLIEADGAPAGECALRRMDGAEPDAGYSGGMDVRCIDIFIFEGGYASGTKK